MYDLRFEILTLELVQNQEQNFGHGRTYFENFFYILK